MPFNTKPQNSKVENLTEKGLAQYLAEKGANLVPSGRVLDKALATAIHGQEK